MHGWFKSFLFRNGFQDSNDPVFFPIMIGDIFFEFLSFPFKKFCLGIFDFHVHYLGITHEIKDTRPMSLIYINTTCVNLIGQMEKWNG